MGLEGTVGEAPQEGRLLPTSLTQAPLDSHTPSTGSLCPPPCSAFCLLQHHAAAGHLGALRGFCPGRQEQAHREPPKGTAHRELAQVSSPRPAEWKLCANPS